MRLSLNEIIIIIPGGTNVFARVFPLHSGVINLHMISHQSAINTGYFHCMAMFFDLDTADLYLRNFGQHVCVPREP